MSGTSLVEINLPKEGSLFWEQCSADLWLGLDFLFHTMWMGTVPVSSLPGNH